MGLAEGVQDLSGTAAGPEPWLAALPCTQHAQHAVHHAGSWALAAPLRALEDAWQALGLERVLAAWGVQVRGSSWVAWWSWLGGWMGFGWLDG